ncbi:hypothetical protein HanIR_Chr08g0381821 [Helianthus annuus]|nr:hypothetical protein HanIR_Chr08g0381821 [Helianthus annuus]
MHMWSPNPTENILDNIKLRSSISSLQQTIKLWFINPCNMGLYGAIALAEIHMNPNLYNPKIQSIMNRKTRTCMGVLIWLE